MIRSIEFHVASDELGQLSRGHLCKIHLPQIDGLFEIADIGDETIMNGQLVRKIKFRSFCFIAEGPDEWWPDEIGINEVKEMNGCPCAKSCCDDPDVVGVEHDCDETSDDFCEEFCYSQCLNCGAQCGCEV